MLREHSFPIEDPIDHLVFLPPSPQRTTGMFTVSLEMESSDVICLWLSIGRVLMIWKEIYEMLSAENQLLL